jgi:predicted nucleic acid-binding protein
MVKARFRPIEHEVEIWNLGDGETEVLSLALVNASNCLALVDDRAARRCADTLGIPTLGTAGLLVVAKSRNLIQAVKPELEKLESSGLYISDEINQAIYRQAGETE